MVLFLYWIGLLWVGYVTGNLVMVESFPTLSNTLKAEKYLRQYGYVEANPDGRNSRDPIIDPNAREIELSKSIRKFQRFTGLPITGKLDNTTVAAFDKPRCGVADIRIVPRDAMGFKWSKYKLTYRVRSNPPQISMGRTREAIKEAFDTWSRVIPLEFTEVSASSMADFTVDFGRYSHGDPYPFDGPGRILAHAMFPPDGRAHFDSDEPWAYRDDKLKDAWDHTDFLAVAIHELGHALGLGHSRTVDSIMAPFYKPAEDFSNGYKAPELHRDDIYHIQRMYGKRRNIPVSPTEAPRVTTTTTTEAATRKPIVRPRPKPGSRRPDWSVTKAPVILPDDGPIWMDECPKRITAGTKALNGKTYIFSESWIWEFDQERMRIGQKTSIKEVFSPGPYTVTAAVTNPRTHFTLLFETRGVWGYLWNQGSSSFDLHPEFPKPLTDKIEFIPSAAFIWADGNLVLLNGPDFATYDPNWNEPTMINKASNYFAGFPKSVSAAIPTDADGLLLLSGTRAFIYNKNSKSMVSDSGLEINELLRC